MPNMFQEAAMHDRYMGYDEPDDQERDCEDCGACYHHCSLCQRWRCDCEPCDCTFVDDRPTPEAEK